MMNLGGFKAGQGVLEANGVDREWAKVRGI